MSLKTIKAYSVDYNKTGMFTNITGLSAHQKFGECGTSTLSLGFQADDTFLKIGTIIVFQDFYSIVEKITINEKGYMLNGFTLERVLYNRSHANHYKYSSMNDFVNAYQENRRGLKLDIVVDPQSTESRSFSKDYEFDGGNFYDEMMEIFKGEGWGAKTSIIDKGGDEGFYIIVTLYKGKNLSIPTNEDCVYFSSDRKNMKDSQIKVDISRKKDVCYVKGKCLDGSYIVVKVGGDDTPTTREMFLDKTSDAQRGESETKDKDGNVLYVTPAEALEDYKTRLYNYGVGELNNRKIEESASMSVVATGYLEKYNLGDIVRCQDKKIGLDVAMVVKQYDIEIDRNGDNRYIRLGDSRAVGV